MASRLFISVINCFISRTQVNTRHSCVISSSSSKIRLTTSSNQPQPYTGSDVPEQIQECVPVAAAKPVKCSGIICYDNGSGSSNTTTSLEDAKYVELQRLRNNVAGQNPRKKTKFGKYLQKQQLEELVNVQRDLIAVRESIALNF